MPRRSPKKPRPEAEQVMSGSRPKEGLHAGDGADDSPPPHDAGAEWLPPPESIVSSFAVTSPSGKKYTIFRTTEKDPADEEIGRKPRAGKK